MQRQGSRIHWAAVPALVRDAVDALVGSPIVDARNVGGGFSPGPAARCTLADGRIVFVKACGVELNPTATAMHRREADVLRSLPEGFPAPRLLRAYDDGDWVALVAEHVDGRMPTAPVTVADAAALLRGLELLAELGTPSPVTALEPAGAAETRQADGWGWRVLATDGSADLLDDWSRRNLDRLVELESTWPDAVAGDTLLHGDVRLDNVLLTADGSICFVDWPSASIGAPWVDLVGTLPALHVDGAASPSVLFDGHQLGRRADPQAVDVYLAALAGYFTHRSLQPPPPGIPAVRSFQAAQGVVAREWLAERTGWN